MAATASSSKPTSPPQEPLPGAALLADGNVVIAQAVLPVWGRQLDVIHAQLNAGIGELTQALVAIHDISDRLARCEAKAAALAELTPELEAQVSHALAGLQIGDRLSQMLTVVRGDMQRLIDRMPLQGEPGLQQAEQWLDELRSRYTTPEQHEVHGGALERQETRGIDYF